jgi:hypothetical protein
MTMNLPCVVCDAPVPVWDYKPHIKSCAKIKLGLQRPSGDLAHADRMAAYQRNAMQGHPAWSPETGAGKEPLEQLKDDIIADRSKEATDKVRNWYQHQRELYGNPRPSAVPEGRFKCHHCNGLTHMYPDCVNCDGRGWV